MDGSMARKETLIPQQSRVVGMHSTWQVLTSVLLAIPYRIHEYRIMSIMVTYSGEFALFGNWGR